MRFYFSGLNGPQDTRMLKKAGVDYVIADMFDVDRGRLFRHFMLDSGAYRCWTEGKEGDLESYYDVINNNQIERYVSMDVIGDGNRTRENYDRMVNDGYEPMPVWHYGTDYGHLEYYLSKSDTVGIGALVPYMRERNEKVLMEVTKLCKDYPNRFHIFGINWCRALNRLRDLIVSGDSSLWLDGARYAHIIYIHRKGYLAHAPKQYQDREYTREERCVLSANNINNFLNK